MFQYSVLEERELRSRHLEKYLKTLRLFCEKRQKNLKKANHLLTLESSFDDEKLLTLHSRFPQRPHRLFEDRRHDFRLEHE